MATQRNQGKVKSKKNHDAQQYNMFAVVVFHATNAWCKRGQDLDVYDELDNQHNKLRLGSNQFTAGMASNKTKTYVKLAGYQ